MKKRLLGAISGILLIAACGRDVPEEPDTAERQREEETKDVEAAATPEPEKEAETAAELKIRLVTNNIQSEDTVEHDGEEAFPIGYISSVSVEVDETSADDYKALAEALENYNTEKADSSLHTLSRIVADAKEDPAFLDVMYSSNTDEETAFVKRADDKILSVGRSTYSFYNGAHPVTWYSSECFDTKTGEQIPLSDIVSDIRALPQQISDNLEYVVDDYTPEAEELEEMHSKIEEIVADGELVWTVSDEAMEIYFSPYVLQSYAFGPIFATLNYSDYPGLLVEEYRADGSSTALESRVSEVTGETKTYSWDELKELAMESYGDGEGAVNLYTYSPDWEKAYVSEDATELCGSLPYSITETAKKDVMFAEDWAAENGYVLPGTVRDQEGRYSEDGYTYQINNDADNGFLSLTVFPDNDPSDICIYNLDTFAYPPEGGEYTTPLIRYAKIYDDTLYLNIAHRTYSSGQPCTAYVLGIDRQTGILKFKSDYLLANCDNFVIYKDTIICGYGFTAEDDHIYILSRYTGEVLKKIKTKTSPDYFVLDGDTLYVICYDTAYTYSLK